MAITLQDVVSAIAKLESSGERVTVLSVRGMIGKGSATTIARFLKQARPASSLPDGLPAKVDPKTFLPGLQRVLDALRDAEAEAKLMGEATNQQIAEAKAAIGAERSAMDRDIEQVLAEAGEARERADQFELRLADEMKRTAVLTVELASERDVARQRLTDIDMQRRLHEQQIDHYKSAVNKAAVDAKELQSRLEAALSEAAELRGRVGVLTATTVR